MFERYNMDTESRVRVWDVPLGSRTKSKEDETSSSRALVVVRMSREDGQVKYS